MNVQLHSTDKIVDLVLNVDDRGQDVTVPARVWEGHTETGVAVHAYITRIAVDRESDTTQFERELTEHRAPSVVVARAVPNRLIL